MTTQDKIKVIIERAVEGGWDSCTCGFNVNGLKGHASYCAKDEHIGWDKSIYLDPDFYRALGKSCGWDKEYKVKGYRIPQISKCCEGKAEMDCNHLKCTLCERFSWAVDFEEPHIFFGTKFHEINLTQSFEAGIDYLYNLVEKK